MSWFEIQSMHCLENAVWWWHIIHLTVTPASEKMSPVFGIPAPLFVQSANFPPPTPASTK